MNRRAITLLAIDDDPESLALVRAALKRDDLEILTTEDPEAGLDLVRRLRPQIVLLDLIMPKLSGLEMLESIIGIDPATEVILITAHYSSETAVEAMQKGASDYLDKPLQIGKLRERIDRLIADVQHRNRADELSEEMVKACRFEGIIGRSPLMLDVFARIRRIAPHFRTALITGDTGTGKELVARAIHSLSPVAGGPFVVANCAAIPENLLESELFGHVRGAFTGAVQDKVGLFEHANNGTLFLDEIGEMPLAAQPKLLRAVQNQEFQRVGSLAIRKVNVRILAATNRDLRTSMKDGDFREDLFFRLSMVQMKLPSLEERKDDLPLLLHHFIQHFAQTYNKPIVGISRRAEAALLRYRWPGNIRELENVIGYACMMTDSTKLDVQDLPDLFGSASQPDASAPAPLVSLDEIQRIHARRVVDQLGGDKTRAAEILGVSRATLYRLLSAKVGTAHLTE
ncbi:MAG: sigma-54-dependent Fis family transcriptional regulator [Bryobacteraceae bacterium]|nr:sigma-54 dependent transcriptional regulator [Bryobacterales bacterium]NUN02438.1 sigma-54-dependent Fis family transcriptional regulator [Bryobacteraceae bacterium]